MTDASIWARALSLAGILFVAYLLTMWAAMVFWTHRDIMSRPADRAQRLVAVAVVALFNAPGFLLYLAVRPPETSAEILARQLEAEALVNDIDRREACAGCGRGVAAEFVVCPYCRTPVQASCSACSARLNTAWVLCPYCGADRPEAPASGPQATPTSPEPVPASPRGALQPAGQRALAPSAKA